MISAVSQNRFSAPQRVQRNNQAQTFGSNKDWNWNNKDYLKAQNKVPECFVAFSALLMLATIGVTFANLIIHSRESHNGQPLPIVDSLSQEK